MTTTIALVDDHRVVTRSLKAWLETFDDLRVVGIAANGEELLEHLADWQPDIVLQDLLMPGGLNGIDTTREVMTRAPRTKVIALTASVDEPRMMGVLRVGAAGYVRKDAEPETLVAAIRAVARGKTYIDPAVASAALRSGPAPESLTGREQDVLRRVALGESNKDIATALAIGDETVKSHVSRLLAKLQVENRAQAIVEALRRGLIAIDDLDQR